MPTDQKCVKETDFFFWKKILVKTQQQDYMNSTYLMNFNKTKKTLNENARYRVFHL